MAISPREAWHKAARLMAQCMGFESNQKMTLYKSDHSFNEAINTHIITFKLHIQHPVDVSSHRPLVKEAEEKKKNGELDLPLLRELNRIANEKDSYEITGKSVE
jgi:hypothetical protein